MDPQELLEAWQRAALEAFGDGVAGRQSIHVPLRVDVEPDGASIVRVGVVARVVELQLH